MRKKYNTDAERKEARMIQNREAQKRRRVKIKAGKKPNEIKKSSNPLINKYTENLYKACEDYPFSYSITLTNKSLVTLNMHDKAVDKLIKWLTDNEYISNFIKTNESDGGNFHSHILVQVNKWGINLRDVLKNKWGNGFYRVDFIRNETHRLNAIKYCFKQINVMSNSDLKQALADTWDVSLIQSYGELKLAESDRLNQYKRNRGL